MTAMNKQKVCKCGADVNSFNDDVGSLNHTLKHYVTQEVKPDKYLPSIRTHINKMEGNMKAIEKSCGIKIESSFSEKSKKKVPRDARIFDTIEEMNKRIYDHVEKMSVTKDPIEFNEWRFSAINLLDVLSSEVSLKLNECSK